MLKIHRGLGFDIDAVRKNFFEHSEEAIKKHTDSSVNHRLSCSDTPCIIPHEILQTARRVQLRTSGSLE